MAELREAPSMRPLAVRLAALGPDGLKQNGPHLEKMAFPNGKPKPKPKPEKEPKATKAAAPKANPNPAPKPSTDEDFSLLF